MPDQVDTGPEVVEGLGTERGAGGVRDQLNRFAASPSRTVPVHRVERQEVGLAVGEVDVDGLGRRRPAEPARGDAAGRAGLLEGAGVGGRRRPDAGAGRAAEGDLGVGGEVRGQTRNVVSIAAVGLFPVALGARVGPQERDGRRTG